MTHRLATLPSLAALLLTTACGPETDVPRSAGVEISVSDSAGVALVVSTGVPARWSVGPAELELGGTGDAALRGPEYELFQVRDVEVDAEGRILVANQGSLEVRVYDRDGAHLAAWGRNGEGPGEFLSVGPIRALPGGEVLVWDGIRSILNRFGPDGGFLEGTRTGAAFPTFGFVSDLLPDGRLMVPAFQGFGVDAPDGLQRRTLDLAVYDPVDDAYTDLGSWAGPEVWVVTRGRAVEAYFLPFAGAAEWAGDSEGRIHIGAGSRAEVRRFSAEGTLERIARWEPGERPSTSVAIEAARTAALEGTDVPAAIRRIGEMYDALPTDRPLPAFVTMLAGPDGEIWLERFTVEGAESSTWDVLDPQGAHAATVELPSDFRPTRIGPDWIIGTLQDDFDVEHVVRHPLDRSGGD